MVLERVLLEFTVDLISSPLPPPTRRDRLERRARARLPRPSAGRERTFNDFRHGLGDSGPPEAPRDSCELACGRPPHSIHTAAHGTRVTAAAAPLALVSSLLRVTGCGAQQLAWAGIGAVAARAPPPNTGRSGPRALDEARRGARRRTRVRARDGGSLGCSPWCDSSHPRHRSSSLASSACPSRRCLVACATTASTAPGARVTLAAPTPRPSSSSGTAL